jgi:ribonuclease T2
VKTPTRWFLLAAAVLGVVFSAGCADLAWTNTLTTSEPAQPGAAADYPAGAENPAAVESPTAPEKTAADNPSVESTPALENDSPPGGWPAVPTANGDFDYYLLALSWAPQYCASNPDDSQECALGKRYAFVLHGLWPQFNKGYPANCSSEPLPDALKAKFPGLYPNDNLLIHEWSKHGTCTGLTPAAYLALTSQFKGQVQIPQDYRAPSAPFRTSADDLVAAFRDANPALTADGVAVNGAGSGRYLSEVYICISKTGQPADCGADVLKSARKSLPNPDFLVRSVR